MKSLITIIAVLYTFSCCTASCSKEDESTSAENNGSVNTNPSSAKMKITIGNAVFTATLYDNPSATAFIALLPLTVNMSELNNNEKYFDFPNPLPTNSSVDGAIKNGDLMLYGSNTLVLFYKNFNTSYSYSKLGNIDNTTGLAEALGNGNMVVKFDNN